MNLSSQLYLIGSTHYDQKGSVRLRRILEKVKPTCIIFEATIEELLFMEEKAASPEEKKAAHFAEMMELFPSARRETISLVYDAETFEYQVIKEYAQRAGIFFAPYDTRVSTHEIDDLVQEELRAFFEKTPAEVAAECEAEYHDESINNIPAPLLTLFEQGDKQTALLLRTCIPRFERVAHIGGTGHLFAAYPNLYTKLRDLDPARIKLCDADSSEYD